MAGPERRDRLDLDEGGSWAVSTESGSHYQLMLGGDEKTILPLAVDTGHSYSDGLRPLRRDGEVFPLLGLIDPPIQVASDAPKAAIAGRPSIQAPSGGLYADLGHGLSCGANFLETLGLPHLGRPTRSARPRLVMPLHVLKEQGGREDLGQASVRASVRWIAPALRAAVPPALTRGDRPGRRCGAAGGWRAAAARRPRCGARRGARARPRWRPRRAG